MKRILVTGAAGFIGFHALKALISRGDTALGLDNFNDYYDVNLKRARQKELPCEIKECDLCDSKKLKKIINEFKPTHVLHLAAQAGVRYSIENPEAYIHSNITGFVTLLEVLKTSPEIPLTYASSSSVYGLSKEMPLKESMRVDSPVSLYGATKKSNEEFAHSYHHLFGMKLTGLRFFTVYGPWGRPDMAYYKFAQAIQKGDPIDVYNHGNLMRDFTYIDDIISGTLAALDNEAPFEIYNLGNNKPVTLLNFIETIEKSVGKEAKKNFLPMQAGDVYETYADIEKAKKELGFSPKTPLEVGIPKFIEWMQSYSS